MRIGNESNANGILTPRPTAPVQGLYLAGAATPWGPGTSGAMLSGLYRPAQSSAAHLPVK